MASKRGRGLGRLGADQTKGKTVRPDVGLSIPQILLEGDEPASTPMTGPGQKYALGPTAPASQFGHEETALPEAYGTGKLMLAARDPHWLYAHWDLTLEQQRRYNALSADRHLVVRIYSGKAEARPEKEVHVYPESRHWFIQVDRGATRYVAELGYYRPKRHWVAIATSPPAVTPADRASSDQSVRFATIPADVRLAQLVEPAKQAIPADLPPLEPAQERALAELASLQLVRKGWAGSKEIAELVRGGGGQEASVVQASLHAALGGEAEAISSPTAPAEERPAGFWLNVNAELVIYGATEVDASVTLGGRPISLRPDGTFSCRLSLPDGEHAARVSAMSAQGDLRRAELKFNRRTEYQGNVGAAPQDPLLQPPAAENP